jgi:hypothetical protein
VRRALLAGALITAALATSGCDQGPPVSQVRNVGSAYTRLEVDGSLNLDIELLNRPAPGVRITAGSKSIDRVKTTVEGGTLMISTKSRGLTIGPDPLGDVQINLGVSQLSGLVVEGNATVQLSGLSAKSFELRVNGSGGVTARGRVDELTMELDGSADVDLSQLATQAADVRTDGSGDTDLRVAQSLNIVMEGSGDVTYRGSPSVNSRLEGSGDLTQAGR